MSWLYVLGLVLSIAGLVLADWRYKLAFFVAPKRTILVLAISLIFFLTWDATGIATDVFFMGTSQYVTGFILAPEMPIEEPIFLLLLCYLPLILWQLGHRLWAPTSS